MLPLPEIQEEKRPQQNMKVTHKSRKPTYDAGFVDELIQIKKKKNADFKRNQPLFFSIGLFLSIGLVVIAFEWKTYDDGEMIELTSSSMADHEIIDIPPTEQLPPPPPKTLQQPNLVEVTEEEIIEEIEVNFDVEMTEQTVITPTEFNVETEDIEEEIADEVFTIVEDQPTPAGGMQSFMQYLYEHIKYPAMAKRLGVEGKVFVEFIVGKDGKLTDVKVIRGIGGGCDEEAVRVIASSPAWNPGKQRGMPVRVKMVMPVHFVLEQ